MHISQADQKILAELQRDATLSLNDLSEKVAMSSSTIWRRIQDMEASGVITGRVTLVDPAMLGLTVCILIHVNIIAQSANARREFETFVAGHDNILQSFAVTGGHDYTLVVRTKTVEEYERFLMDELLAHPSVDSSSSHLVLRQQKNATALPL